MIGFKPKARRASTPEIDSRTVQQNPEFIHIPQEMMERKAIIDQASQRLESTVSLRALSVGNAQPLIPTDLRIMRSVAKREEIKSDEMDITDAIVQTDSKSPTVARSAEHSETEADAKVIKLDEHRARYLMDKDARRQVDEAFDTDKQVVAEVVEPKEAMPRIPDIHMVEPAVVVEARAEVERALQAQAEALRNSAQRQQDTAELMAFMAEHHQQRRAA